MTKFTDQLFDDLMREHGQTLAHTSVPTPKRFLATRPVLLTAGAGGLAVAATVGSLTIGGAAPAYAVTPHSDGTVTLAVYQQSGLAGANAKLRQLGDRVIVLPVRSGCPSIDSLRAPKVPAVRISGQGSASSDGSVTVKAQGVPAEDMLVVGFETTTSGPGHPKGNGHGQETRSTFGASKLTSGPLPSCVSIPAGATPGPASGSGSCKNISVPPADLPASGKAHTNLPNGGKASGGPSKAAGQGGQVCTQSSGQAGSA
jgi:hypothetical protein